MSCEICGQKTTKVHKVLFDGEVILACERCIKRYNLAKVSQKKKYLSLKGKKDLLGGTILVNNYAKIIKESRERKGLSQEKLAKIVGEKVSIIKRIEAGKLIPSDSLVKRLERVLKVRLKEKIE